MRLFVVGNDPAFPSLRPVRDEAWRWRGGSAVGAEWEVPELVPVEDGGQEFIAADCLGLVAGSDGVLVSEDARRALAAVLEEAGEFLPVGVLGRRYYWFNCLARADALDRAQTDADWGLVEGAWGSFRWITSTRRLAFAADRVADAPAMFRIPEYPQGALFARTELVERVGAAELTGFRFDLVWSAEAGGVVDPVGLGFRGVFEAADDRERQRRRDRARELLRRRANG